MATVRAAVVDNRRNDSDIFPFLRHIRKPIASPQNPIALFRHSLFSFARSVGEEGVYHRFSLLLKAHLCSFPI
ncbi:hypothetical protein Fmac_021210 [Flemingia macrophylla]|uniref:Uncharacterized protein n=1 Tax=Flemingia macrophylla TaxID=520843 RepID=A0ABD1LWQ1_9FABA